MNWRKHSSEERRLRARRKAVGRAGCARASSRVGCLDARDPNRGKRESKTALAISDIIHEVDSARARISAMAASLFIAGLARGRPLRRWQ
jgi:hypothetical protein